MHVVGAGTMGGDIAAWCALRGLTVTLQDQNAERLAPAMKRAAKLFAERLKDPRRVRDARDRLIPDVAGDGVARADVIIEAIFENLEAKRALFAALETKAKPDAILATNTSSIPLEDIAARAADPSRLVGLHFFNPVPQMMLVEIVAGRATRDELVAARRGVRAPDRQAAAAGEERAGLPRQPRARAVPDGGDALRRRRHRARDRRRGRARVRHADGSDRARRHRRASTSASRSASCSAAAPRRREARWSWSTPASSARRPGAASTLGRRQAAEAARPGAVPAGPRRPAGRAVRRRSEGGAGRTHRRRRRPGRRRRDLRHRLRAVPRRSAALRASAQPDTAPDGEAARRCLVRMRRETEARRTRRAECAAERTRHCTRRGGASWKRSGSSSYPKGVPAEIDVNEYASVREVFEESVRQVRRAPRVHVHGQDDHVRRARHAVGGVRRVPAGHRLQEGRARRADDAQHPAVPGVPVRHRCAPAARWSTSIRCTRRASSSTSSTTPAPR